RVNRLDVVSRTDITDSIWRMPRAPRGEIQTIKACCGCGRGRAWRNLLPGRGQIYLRLYRTSARKSDRVGLRLFTLGPLALDGCPIGQTAEIALERTRTGETFFFRFRSPLVTLGRILRCYFLLETAICFRLLLS